jgi:DNA-binding response OmpR family regulator
MLPDGDGLDLLRELRRAGDATPAICVTARDPVQDRVEGLEAGADDYLIKPFAFEELLARMAAVCRRARAGELLRVADLRIDVRAHRAWRGDQELALTPQEFRLLLVLAQGAGTVLSRRDLLERVWDTHHDPGTNVVDVYVRYLRNKVERPDAPTLIHTVRGVGYVIDDRPRSSP